MSKGPNDAVPAAVNRVCCGAYVRCAGNRLTAAEGTEFKPDEEVRSLRPVKNDGVYPHKDIGETLVQCDDIGTVRERWSFLGETYYTVEFGARAAVVIMRGREMARSAAP